MYIVAFTIGLIVGLILEFIGLSIWAMKAYREHEAKMKRRAIAREVRKDIKVDRELRGDNR